MELLPVLMAEMPRSGAVPPAACGPRRIVANGENAEGAYAIRIRDRRRPSFRRRGDRNLNCEAGSDAERRGHRPGRGAQFGVAARVEGNVSGHAGGSRSG
jgi:hypothetical protein